MDSFLVILLVIGLIIWLENTRLNKSIRHAWKNLEEKPIVQSLKNPQSLITIRKYLRQDVEVELLKLGIDASNDDTSMKPNSKEEQVLSQTLLEYTIAMNPTIKEVVDKVVIKLKTPVKVNTPMTDTEDATKALQKLGYAKLKVKKAITIVLSKTDGELTSPEIITRALIILNE